MPETSVYVYQTAWRHNPDGSLHNHHRWNIGPRGPVPQHFPRQLESLNQDSRCLSKSEHESPITNIELYCVYFVGGFHPFYRS
jgi:hypothetical protein